MSNAPDYIKFSDKIITKTWKNNNPEVFGKFVELGEKLKDCECSLYLIGSAAGTEENENVGDIDIIVFFKNVEDLKKVELLTRPYKHLEGTALTIRYQYYPKSFLQPYKFNPGFNPVYYTAIKTINNLIYGEDVLNGSNWLEETTVKDYSKMLVIEECLMVARVINKQKWTDKQNSTIMQKLIDILLSLMLYKGYFGYSKTDIFALVSQSYNFKNAKIPNLMSTARKSGAHTFYEREPKELQTECLDFCQDILKILEV